MANVTVVVRWKIHCDADCGNLYGLYDPATKRIDYVGQSYRQAVQQRSAQSKRKQSGKTGIAYEIVFGAIEAGHPDSTVSKVTASLVDSVENLIILAGQPLLNIQGKKTYTGGHRNLRVVNVGRVRRVFDTRHLYRYLANAQ